MMNIDGGLVVFINVQSRYTVRNEILHYLFSFFTHILLDLHYLFYSPQVYTVVFVRRDLFTLVAASFSLLMVMVVCPVDI